jgi:hypothetical protein
VYYNKDLNFVETTTADFSTGTLSNVVAENDSLRLDKIDEDITDIDNDNASFSEGTLTDVEAVNDNLQLAQPQGIFEGFEDGTTSPLTTGSFSGTVDTTSAIFGIYGFHSDSGVPDVGDRTLTGGSVARSRGGIATYVKLIEGGTNSAGVAFCFNHDTEDGYVAIAYTGIGFQLRGGAGAGTLLAEDTNVTINTNTIYIVEIKATSTTIIANLYDENYNLLSQLSVNDTQYTSGEMGIYGFGESYFDAILFKEDKDDFYLPFNGTRQSPQLDISAVGNVESSSISWQETLNSQTITIETSVDGGSTWQTATNGGAIPNLPSDPTTLDVRQVLSTTDTTVTPRLESLEVEVVSAYETTGYRISKPFDLSPAVEDGGSTISWQETAPTNTSITVETSTDDGVTWDTATNGQPIPNLPNDLTNVELKYKTTLNTSDTSS